MKLVLYSVLDRKLREFGGPFVDRNEESMRRSLETGVKGSGAMMEKYPEDFDVYVLGEFETETGVVTPAIPQFITSVYDILESGNGASRS